MLQSIVIYRIISILLDVSFHQKHYNSSGLLYVPFSSLVLEFKSPEEKCNHYPL
jgi:hypothetical protein